MDTGKELSMVKGTGKELELQCDFGDEKGLADLTLNVEGKTIPVMKGILCIASPVLYTLLESKTELDMPEKKYDDVVEFLLCIYPDKLKKITDNNVYQVLPFASEYQVQKLRKRSGKVLLQKVRQQHIKDALELYRHIHLAELYGLDELKQTCISAASDLKIDELLGARKMHAISVESDLKVKELLIKKHELDRADDLQLDMISQQPAKQNQQSTTVNPDKYFHDFLWNKMSYPSTPAECLRSVRLWKRYFPHNDRSALITKLRQMNVNDSPELQEEFQLLPEEIKQALL
ncbi:uncharacterized protein LOC123553500 [Mercenaria mercenaria]|uniref:uncharacterized protein LOC123553500 n=1 Tax=Mercenaria mercenaria TaxID=6596 RepID=UPI00234E6264|nr:uncharacterized protein LOC123553500 [Mercenaria mercenaria]